MYPNLSPLSDSKQSFKSIIIENKYWQVLETAKGTFKMFNAYYDNREFYQNQPLIRIIAFINGVDPVVKTFCQLSYSDLDQPLMSEAFEYLLMWLTFWGINEVGSQLYLISCVNPLAIANRIPVSVSLGEREGNANE